MAKKKLLISILIIGFFVVSIHINPESRTVLQQDPAVTSSESCKECHAEIYGHWKNAMHSMSIEDPIFQASYLQSYLITQGEAKYNCLRCHAPVALINNDYDLKNKITQEGVTCDFCHSVKKVNLNNKENPFELDLSDTKRGPLSNVTSPAHETEPSPLFKSSELCAGCHEYTNDNGVTVLGTYSEWKASAYAADGTQCQNCHMPVIEGNVVKPEIKPSTQKRINLHAISASHSTKQLRKALKVEIAEINKQENFIEVVVAVTNSGSGHSVPTGIPARKLILWVELRTSNEYFSQKRAYQRILQDEHGNEINKVFEVFMNAAKVQSDTRIKPKETRTENFVFAMPKNEKITLTARIEYLYKADVMSPTEMRVKMAEDKKAIIK